MASLLPLNIKKEDDILPRASLFPKRKTAIANIPPRARFAKARPNIGGIASKTSKDTKPTEPEKKSTVTEEPKSNETKETSQISNAESTAAVKNLQSSESEPSVLETPSIKEEKEILQRPSALSKRTLATPPAPRARYQKARPNIAALANKKPKPINTPNDGVETPSKEKNVEDSPNLNQSETQENIEKESMAQSTSVVKPITDPEPVVGFSFSKGVMEVFPEKSSNVEPVNSAENQLSEILDSLISEALYAVNEEEVIPISEDCVVLNSVEEQESSETAAKDPQTPEKKKSNYLKMLSKTSTKCHSEAGKEGAASTSIFSKSNEYPTLKSILNSPRKRVTTKKTYERKRRLANLSETPSRSEMTMTDLIYYNPAGEPMKVKKPQTCAVENLPADENTKPVEEEPPPEEEESSNPPVPKVIINENGEIIIDESSLVVARKETIDTSVEPIIENDNTTYSSFRKKSAKQWSNKETSKFYKALSLVGTDFALMENIFTVNGNVTRSRRELKLKFKREEKLRLNLVHKAMYETQTYDISILEDDPDDFFAENVDEPPEPSAPKKRGRKPKAVVGNENKPNAPQKKNKARYSTSDSINENVETIYEVSDAESNDVLRLNGQANSNGHESNPDDDQTSKSKKNSRPQRARKNKTLTDYITDVEESEHSDDYLSDSNSEAITKKKPPDTSETAEVTDSNGQSILIVKPKRGRKRKSPVLPPDYFETSEEQDTETNILTKESFIIGPPETEYTVSRLGRVRRTRILTDFITDEEETEGSDDESVKGVGIRNKARILSENSNGDSCIMVEQIDSLPDNSTVEVIAKVKEESEESPEVLVIPQNITEKDQDIIIVPTLRESSSCDLTDNHRTAVSNAHMNSNLSQSGTQNNTVCNKMPSTSDINNASSVNIQHSNIGLKRKASVGEIQCVELEQPSSERVVNLLDAASEVVITDSTKAKRMRRRAAMPNLAQAKRRPGLQTEVPQVKPSFSNFTPKESSANPSKAIISRPFEPLWTYSRKIKKESETVSSVQADGEVIIVNSDNSAQENRNLRTSFQNNSVPGTSFNYSIPGSSFQNNSTAQTLPKNNSVTGTSLQNSPVPGTSFEETNQTVLNFGSSVNDQQMVLEPTSFPQKNQTILGSTLSFPNSQAIALDSDGTSTDPPPVMIFTKSPNNENILHLFMVQSPKPSY